jgi:hypothetical protein
MYTLFVWVDDMFRPLFWAIIRSQNEFYEETIKRVYLLIYVYLSIAIGLTPGGSTHLHINNT